MGKLVIKGSSLYVVHIYGTDKYMTGKELAVILRNNKVGITYKRLSK